MGGHGHGHHGDPYTIPDYKIYKVENAPLLKATQKALASQGLKDPWLRNEVWRYDVKHWGTEPQKLRALMTTGFRVGFVAFVATVIGTAVYDKMFPSKHGHGHGHESH